MGFNDLQRIPTLSGGKFAMSFPRIVLLYLLVFCFVSVFFAGPAGAAESAWQTVVGEGESGTSPSGMVPFTTTPAPVPVRQSGGGITIKPGLVKEAFSLHSNLGVRVNSVVPGAELRAGEKAIIELKLEGSLGYVGRVNIEIDGKAHGIAKNPRPGYYVYEWDIPKRSGKKVHVVSRVRPLTGDKNLASYSRMITIQPALATGACYFWYGVNPAVPGAPLQAGERATIELKVQGAVDLIGRVEIEIDGGTPNVASNQGWGHYVLNWKIPEKSAKQVEIVWRVHNRADDEVVRTFTRKVAVQSLVVPFQAAWKEFPQKIGPGESKKVVVEVAGGSAPYTYFWEISTYNNTLRKPYITLNKKTCEYEIGPYYDSKIIDNNIIVEVRIRDYEGIEKKLKGSISPQPSAPLSALLPLSSPSSTTIPELKVSFVGYRSKLKVWEEGVWSIACNRAPFRVDFNWGDNTPVTKVSGANLDCDLNAHASHSYNKIGNYVINAIVMDRGGPIARLTKEVEIISVKPDIIDFIGPKDVRVGRPAIFKVKMKHGQPLYAYTFYFGDNVVSEEFLKEDAGIEVVHTYLAAGVYTVRVRVEDIDGVFDEMKIQVTVTE